MIGSEVLAMKSGSLEMGGSYQEVDLAWGVVGYV